MMISIYRCLMRLDYKSNSYRKPYKKYEIQLYQVREALLEYRSLNMYEHNKQCCEI